jgi:hypothetical protein
MRRPLVIYLNFLIGKLNFLFYQCNKCLLNWTLVSWQSNCYFLQRFAKGTTPDIRSRRYKLASKASGLHLIQDSWEYRYAYSSLLLWEYRYSGLQTELYSTAENTATRTAVYLGIQVSVQRSILQITVYSTGENTGTAHVLYNGLPVIKVQCTASFFLLEVDNTSTVASTLVS